MAVLDAMEAAGSNSPLDSTWGDAMAEFEVEGDHEVFDRNSVRAFKAAWAAIGRMRGQ